MNKKERNIDFFDNWARTYDRCILSIWLKNVHRDVARFIAKKPGMKILDISCGTGEMLLMFSKRFEKASLHGVDISHNMLRIAEKKLKNKAVVRHADAESLPFKDNMFDYVITAEAFHHYVNQEKSFLEMRRVLKKNGRMIIADVNFFSSIFHRIFEAFEPGCVRINSRKEFRRMFARHGMKDLKQIRSSIFAIITAGRKA